MTDDKCDLLFGALGLGNFRTLEFGSSCCTTRGIPKTIPPPRGAPPRSRFKSTMCSGGIVAEGRMLLRNKQSEYV